jgi:hypothetical protein
MIDPTDRQFLGRTSVGGVASRRCSLLLVTFLLLLTQWIAPIPARAQSCVGVDRYADAVQSATPLVVTNEAEALGAPDSDSALIVSALGVGSLVLDLGAGERGVGDLIVHSGPIAAAVATTVEFLDDSLTVIGTGPLNLAVTALGGAVYVNNSNDTTPYRYVRFSGLVSAYTIDAIEADRTECEVQLCPTIDRYADAVQGTTGGVTAVLNPEFAVGPPNGNVATLVAALGGTLTLDLGANERGLGDLRVFHGLIDAAVVSTVQFLDDNFNMISSGQLNIGITVALGAVTVVDNPNETTPYRYVRFAAVAQATTIDAVQAVGVLCTDTDGDGVPDDTDADDDNDGIPDSVECPSTPCRDSDGDGVPDSKDLDSDNDSINDVREAGGLTDANNDGKADGVDGNGDGMIDSPQTNPTNTDGDSVPDYRDLDSDNDSLSDLFESGSGATDADDNGVADLPDSDGDGIVDSADGLNGFGDQNDPLPRNSEGTAPPDFQDPDSDGDGFNDIVENGNGGLDGNNDGRIDTVNDPEGDGIANNVDTQDSSFGGLPAPTIPAPVITSPANGSTTSDTTPTISGTSRPGADIVVKEGGTTLCTTRANASGIWSCDSSALSAGSHTITATASSFGLTSPPSTPVTFTIDTGAPANRGVNVNESFGFSTVTEGFNFPAGYTIKLLSKPTANVTVNITPDGQLRVDKTKLTFTPDNWSKAQQVRMMAVDDNAAENTHSGVIAHTVSSNDPNYNGAGVPFVGNGPDPDSNPRTINVEVLDNDSGTPIIISSNSNGTLPGVGSYGDEDLLLFNRVNKSWQLIFDGSDVGLEAQEVDAFTFLPNGHLLLSVEVDFNLPGQFTANGQTLAVDDADLLKFVPTSLGGTTNGKFSLHLDGSAVGLNTDAEDIDAVGLAANGDLLVSVTGNFSAPGATGVDEDVFRWNGSQWSLFFDGSAVKLTTTAEDVIGLHVEGNQLYLSALGKFTAESNGKITGGNGDLFSCEQATVGALPTNCLLRLYWKGGNHGLGTQLIDDLYLGLPPGEVPITAAGVADQTAPQADDTDEPNALDGTEESEEEELSSELFLPLVSN